MSNTSTLTFKLSRTRIFFLFFFSLLFTVACLLFLVWSTAYYGGLTGLHSLILLSGAIVGAGYALNINSKYNLRQSSQRLMNKISAATAILMIVVALFTGVTGIMLVGVIFFGFGTVVFLGALIVGLSPITLSHDGVIVQTSIFTRRYVEPWSNITRIIVPVHEGGNKTGDFFIVFLHDYSKYSKSRIAQSQISIIGSPVAVDIGTIKNRSAVIFDKVAHFVSENNIPVEVSRQ